MITITNMATVRISEVTVYKFNTV